MVGSDRDRHGGSGMAATGANRMPMAKLHPVLMGKKPTGGGGGILAQHRMALAAKRGEQSTGSPQPANQSIRQPTWNPRQDQKPPPPQDHRGPPPQFTKPPPPSGAAAFNPNVPPPGWGNQPSQVQSQTKSPSQPTSKPTESTNDEVPKKRRKKSRWGDETEKAAVAITTLPSNLTEEQRKHYLLNFKIEEISQKLRTGELGIPLDPGARSPSPEPIYSGEGKRLNTREYRVRKKLEEERHTLIKQAIEEIPDYKPPGDYKPPPIRVHDKVFLPQDKNPHINFIGLLIGPRGNTQKKMEKDTGCRIIIRGKGSVKEGKVGKVAGQLMPGEDEPLHAMITGPSEKEVKHAVDVINKIVKEGVENPDQANELRQNQMRELAKLNGTLIEDEIIKCKNCGGIDHKHWECSEQKNATQQISCTKCGGYGHIAADCRVNRTVVPGVQPAATGQTYAEKAKMDNEYLALMAELGGEAPPPPKQPASNEKTQPPPAVTPTPKPSTPASASATTPTAPPAKANNYSNFQPAGKAPPTTPRGPAPNAQAPRAATPRTPTPRTPTPRPSKWGPPADKPQPMSLMDMNVRGPPPNMQQMNNNNNNNNQRGQAPWNQQRNQTPPQRHGGPPPWNQQKGPPPNGPRPGGFGGPPPSGPPSGPPAQNSGYPGYPSQGGPPAGQAPWQQRGPPPSTAYPQTWNRPPPPTNTQPPPSGFPNHPPPGNFRGPPPPANYNVPPPPPNSGAPPPWAQQPPPPPPPGSN